MNLKTFKIGILDRYIIGKFLATYIGIVIMLVIVIVIFDMTEKLDDLMEYGAPMNEIIFTYYGSFAPSLVNRFSSLIIFIATVLFTSRMAYNTEIVAILSSGVSFKRMLYPYLLASICVCCMSLALDLYIIPVATKTQNDFNAQYTKKGQRDNYEDYIYRQLSPTDFFSLKGYNNKSKTAETLTLTSYKDSKQEKFLMAKTVKFNEETLHWTAKTYLTREFEDNNEILYKGKDLDTMVNLTSNDIGKVVDYARTLKIGKLNEFISEQVAKGSDKVPQLEVDRQRRFAYPLSAIVLTVIAVSISSRKVRGGTGIHMALGIAICFSYILFMQVSNEFGNTGVMSPILAVWLPNCIYAIVAVFLYHKAPK